MELSTMSPRFARSGNVEREVPNDIKLQNFHGCLRVLEVTTNGMQNFAMTLNYETKRMQAILNCSH